MDRMRSAIITLSLFAGACAPTAPSSDNHLSDAAPSASLRAPSITLAQPSRQEGLINDASLSVGDFFWGGDAVSEIANGELFIADNNADEVVFATAGFSLPAGQYRLTFNAELDGPQHIPIRVLEAEGNNRYESWLRIEVNADDSRSIERGLDVRVHENSAMVVRVYPALDGGLDGPAAGMGRLRFQTFEVMSYD